jgi:hypothetical protein
MNEKRYQIEEKLGHGGEAVVFLVKDKNEDDMEYFIFLVIFLVFFLIFNILSI